MKNEILIRRNQNQPFSQPDASTFFGTWGDFNSRVGTDTRTTVRIIEENELRPSIREALQSLREIARLQDSWDGYGAVAPFDKVIKESEGFIRRLNILQQDIYFVSPGPNGNLLVEIRNGERTIGFHFHPEKALQFVCFEGKNFVNQGTYEPPIIYELLNWLHT